MKLGRIRRRDYFLSIICILFIQFLLYGSLPNVDNYENYDPSENLVSIIFSLVLGVLAFFKMIQRLHDVNLSGWYSLLAFIPIINIGLLFVLFLDGTAGPNYYGEDPKKRLPKSNKISIDHNNIETERKLKLLQDGLDRGVITPLEFENKIRAIKVDRDFDQQQKMLEDLYNEGLLSKEEYQLKLKENELNNSHRFKILPTTMLYYISHGKEIGPFSAAHIVNLVKRNEINGNCFVRHVNQKEVYGRAKELNI